MDDIQKQIQSKHAERQLNIFNSFVESKPVIKNNNLEKGGKGSGHPLSGHMPKILSSVDKWGSVAGNEKQFISNLHATIATLTNNKFKHSDLTDGQKETVREKWLGVRNKK